MAFPNSEMNIPFIISYLEVLFQRLFNVHLDIDITCKEKIYREQQYKI